MIFGIVGGSICAGRNSFAQFISQKFGFKVIDIF